MTDQANSPRALRADHSKCHMCGHICSQPHEAPSDHAAPPVTTGSSASTPPATITQPQPQPQPPSPPSPPPPPPYDSVVVDTGAPDMVTSTPTSRPAAAPWDAQYVQSLTREREREYLLKRERLVDEIIRRWQEEWNKRSLPLRERLIERKLAVYWASTSRWSIFSGRADATNQHHVEERNLKAEMIVAFRQKYRPLIEQLEQDYLYERGKFGKVVVARHNPYIRIDI